MFIVVLFKSFFVILTIMMTEIKIIALAIAFFAPFSWAVSYLIDGIDKGKSKIYVFLLMLFSAFVFLMAFFKFMGHLELYTILFPINVSLVLTLFPLLFLYINSITSEKILSLRVVFPHFIFPFIIFLFFIFYQKGFLNTDMDLLFIRNILGLSYDAETSVLLKIGKIVYDVGRLFFVIFSLIYVVFIFIKVKDFYNKDKDLFSETKRNTLSWLKILAVFFVLMMFSHLAIHILNNNQVLNNINLIVISHFMFAAFFWILGINAFRQSEIFDSVQINETEHYDENIKISKEELEDYLNNEKPFLNPEISVYDFCYRFHTNRTYLSEAINKSFSLNFRGLINQYRVQEAVDLIEQYKRMKLEFTLEFIATKTGFSSYSSFLRVFKAELGLTPNEYVKNKIIN